MAVLGSIWRSSWPGRPASMPQRRLRFADGNPRPEIHKEMSAAPLLGVRDLFVENGAELLRRHARSRQDAFRLHGMRRRHHHHRVAASIRPGFEQQRNVEDDQREWRHCGEIGPPPRERAGERSPPAAEAVRDRRVRASPIPTGRPRRSSPSRKRCFHQRGSPSGIERMHDGVRVMDGTPNRRNIAAVADFPIPIDPVSPRTKLIRRSRRRAGPAPRVRASPPG